MMKSYAQSGINHWKNTAKRTETSTFADIQKLTRQGPEQPDLTSPLVLRRLQACRDPFQTKEFCLNLPIKKKISLPNLSAQLSRKVNTSYHRTENDDTRRLTDLPKETTSFTAHSYSTNCRQTPGPTKFLGHYPCEKSSFPFSSCCQSGHCSRNLPLPPPNLTQTPDLIYTITFLPPCITDPTALRSLLELGEHQGAFSPSAT